MLTFNPSRIQEMLLTTNQNASMNKCPNRIRWLVNSDPAFGPIYKLNNYPSLEPLIRNIALQRGILAICSLFDLGKMIKTRAREIRGGNLKCIHFVLTRYDIRFELLGQVWPFEKSTQIDWILVQEFNQQSLGRSSANMLMALRSGLEEAIDTMVKRYVRHTLTQESQAIWLVLTVKFMNDIETYTQVLDYRHHFPVIQHAHIQRMGEDEISLQMLVMGGRCACINGG